MPSLALPLALLALPPLVQDPAPSRLVLRPAPGSPLRVGPMAGRPVLGDLDEDGRLDVAVACGTCCGSPPDPESGHVAVLLGDGRGGLRPVEGHPLPIGESARKLALGDIDGDGHLDAAVAQHDSYEVVLLLGDGRGGLRPSPFSPIVAGTGKRPHTHEVALVDLDGDGHLDLSTTNANDDTVSLLVGDGRGDFDPWPDGPLASGRHPYDTLGFADLDGDGRLDVVVPNLGPGQVTVLLQDETRGFVAGPGSPHRTAPRPGTLALGDLDRDGHVDLVACHDDEPLLSVLLGDGRGRFSPGPGSPLRFDGSAFWGAALGDLDGDGILDLASGAQLRGVRVLLGDGQGGFARAPGSTLDAGLYPNYVALGDLDGDGDLDLVATSYGEGTLSVWLNERPGGG